MSIVIRMMAGRRLRGTTLPAILTLWLVCACGGSGSSGFDEEPAGEPEAITQAADGEACVAFAGTTYCAMGAFFELEGDSVSLDIDPSSAPLACTAMPEEDACTVMVTVLPQDLPAGAAVLVAAAETAYGPWRASEDGPSSSSGDTHVQVDTQIEVPASGGVPAEASLVIAALVYLDGAPAEVPAETPTLADLGPDVVFVSAELEVQAQEVP